MRFPRLFVKSLARRVFVVTERRVLVASLLLVGGGLWWVHPPLGMIGAGWMLWRSLQTEGEKA